MELAAKRLLVLVLIVVAVSGYVFAYLVYERDRGMIADARTADVALFASLLIDSKGHSHSAEMTIRFVKYQFMMSTVFVGQEYDVLNGSQRGYLQKLFARLDQSGRNLDLKDAGFNYPRFSHQAEQVRSCFESAQTDMCIKSIDWR
ncbi:hypothetical protein [Salinisphaera sp. T31B1]|uniref:hypothetical protein n=1 Tax=Salinisphaera sp. T31B1 TaxID=727963 RepID=UPI00333F6E11